MESDPLTHGLAGVCAGMCGTLLGYPMDVVKTHMQSRPKSIATTVKGIVEKNGIMGFYRGVGPPLLALTWLNAQTFSLYSQLPFPPAMAGACCGIFSAIISTPFELIKVRVALGLSPNAVRAVRDLGGKIYVGHGVNTLRECVFLGSYFGVFAKVRAGIDHGLGAPIAGACAGATGWIVSYPLDCVKTHVQKAQGTTQSSWIIVLFDIVQKRGGWHALYSGVIPSIARACAVSAVRFSVFEAAFHLIRQQRNT